MQKIIIALFTLIPSLVLASGPSLHLDEAGNDLSDKASLKRGFESYMSLQRCC